MILHLSCFIEQICEQKEYHALKKGASNLVFQALHAMFMAELSVSALATKMAILYCGCPPDTPFVACTVQREDNCDVPSRGLLLWVDSVGILR